MMVFSDANPMLLIAIVIVASATIIIIISSVTINGHQKKYIAIDEVNAMLAFIKSLTQAAQLSPASSISYIDVAERIITDNIEGAHEAITVIQTKGNTLITSPEAPMDINALNRIASRLSKDKAIWLSSDDIYSLGIKWRHALALCLEDNGERRFYFIPSTGMPEEKINAITALLQTALEANQIQRSQLSHLSVVRLINERLQSQHSTFTKVLSGLVHNIRGNFAQIHLRIGGAKSIYSDRGILEIDYATKTILDTSTILSSISQMLDMIGTKMHSFIDKPELIEKHIKTHNLNHLFSHCFNDWLDRQVSLSALSLSVDIPEHFYVDVEETSFFQCIWNVLRNAFRYTKEGSISVTANEGQDGLIYLHIRDTGIGMTPEQLEKIGEFGYRATSVEYAKGEGVGIWFSRRMITVMGGNIDISSTKGEGSVFSLGFRSGTETL